MTDEQIIQEAVTRVLAALKTNGKTVNQLTAVTTVGASDYIELNGGRRVACSVLVDAVLEAVDDTLDDIQTDIAGMLIQEVAIQSGPGIVTLSITQAGHLSKRVNIPIASASNPGLLTSAEKNRLDFDSEPTEDSEKGVESGGVFHAIEESKEQAISRATKEAFSKNDIESGGTEDFGIYDEDYNALMQLKEGHVMTKHFDSRKSPATDANTATDFEITDPEGNVIMRIENGHIKTKRFDSSRICPLLGSPSVYLPAYSDTAPSLLGGVSEVYAAYEALAAAYPMYFTSNGAIGTDASGTYEVRHYTLGFNQPRISTDRDAGDPNLWSDTAYKRRRLLITSGCHPTEQPSMLGCYQAVSEILESGDPWAMFIKNNLVLDIVPLINPWGLAQSTVKDVNANGKNVNRTYFSDIQQENTNIINLITDLMPKGLVGVIDCHNGAWYDNDGYFVSKSAYKRWDYYCVLSQQISSMANGLFEQAFGTVKNHFHMWDASANSGQLHEYANGLGLLACTFEVRNKLTQGGVLFTKGAQITRTILINIINAFGTN